MADVVPLGPCRGDRVRLADGRLALCVERWTTEVGHTWLTVSVAGTQDAVTVLARTARVVERAAFTDEIPGGGPRARFAEPARDYGGRGPAGVTHEEPR